MKRSWKRTRIWRRLVSGLLTAVMLVTMLPTAAYAALLDNTPDQNRQILEELTGGMTLLPGTIIATGTPAGVGMGFDPPRFLQSGDTVECAIEGIGTLCSTVI